MVAAALPPGRFLFTSESVTEGQPDKLCDRIADAVLDACVGQDADARVSCEAVTKTGMVMILGEVVTRGTVDYEEVMRQAVKSVGYDSEEKGLDWRTMNVIIAVEEQSPDLAHAITTAGKSVEEIGVGQQGVAFGYATDETPEMIPLSHQLAARLCAQLDKARKDGVIRWACPGARVQVTVEYKEEADGSVCPARVHSVAVSTQQTSDMTLEQVEKELMEHVVKPALPAQLCDGETAYLITPAGKPGATSDAGASGRQLGSDFYGGWGSVGSGSASGKDASKISRSAVYGARWAARSLVAAKLCKRCLVQLSYAPGEGSPAPASIMVNSYGTAKACGKTDADLVAILSQNFDFRPGCLQRDLGLKAPQFQKLAAHGHLGRSDLDLAWEKPKELK